VLRTALRPRFLGLLGVVVAVGAVFVWLGSWQLGVAESAAQRDAVTAARAQAPAELTTLLEPHAPFRPDLSSRPVTATGRYAAEGQLLVADRRLEGRGGLWVLTPFVIEGTGATIPVVRGFVTDAAAAGAPPEGRLTIAGGLAPGESPAPSPVDEPGRIGSVDLSVLVNTWPGDLYNAFVFLQRETPATGPQLPKVPTPLGDVGVRWRNAAYAVQWWVFAAFALWLWLRMVREEARRVGAPRGGAGQAAVGGAGQAAGGDAGQPAGGDEGQPVVAGDNGARDDA
jgi:cytochrome oxidase assembly protein ShyY1